MALALVISINIMILSWRKKKMSECNEEFYDEDMFDLTEDEILDHRARNKDVQTELNKYI